MRGYRSPCVTSRARTLRPDLVELENRYWRALKNGDSETVTRLTDGCIIAGPHGVRRLSKQAIRGMVNSASYALQSFKISDAQARLLREDVAILAYQLHEEVIVDGEALTIDSANVSAWVRHEGRWVCSLHTESLRGDPFGRSRPADR